VNRVPEPPNPPIRPAALRLMALAHRVLHATTRGRLGSLEPGNQAPKGRALAVITALHVRLYRATFGVVGASAGGLSTLLLTTTGRKTGLRHTVALPYFPCQPGGESVFVVASFAGSERHPAWYTNLLAKPEVELQIRARKFSVVAHTAEGEERLALAGNLLRMAPFYFDYQAVTARKIPIVVFSRPGSESASEHEDK
jgi:deazaflavin-dependent oxidoreductase (nitroreductase family)